MGTSQLLPFLFIFFPYTAISAEICSDFLCNGEGPLIRFPFRLTLESKRCGYPGFDLTCNDQSRTVLNLPSSGDFWVQAIDYARQEILIQDPDNCLPRRLHSFNLSGSPFKGYNYQKYTLFHCPLESGTFQFPFITCLSNFTHGVWATLASMADVGWMTSRGCKSISTISVPVPRPAQDSGAYSYIDLNDGIFLTWDEPNCGACEARRGRCGFKNRNSSETGCFDVPRRGLPRSVRYAIIMVGIIPALTCAIGIACYICGRVKTIGRSRYPNAESASSTVTPQAAIVMTGLDETTIESYPKVVLGESRRLPKPDDSTCPICLSEYRPKQTVRSIPDCKHCFHADCIDEWLRMNATCPLCRNSPMPLTSAEAV